MTSMFPTGNGDGQHAERQEGVPDCGGGGQDQMGFPQLRLGVDAQRDGAALAREEGGGARGGQPGRAVLHTCE